ncbi:MAG TPA: hypothetical protein VFB58_00200 [Chloroflexota bacterium]|nr:hypothetical protein [Chloroflexota bacterium]
MADHLDPQGREIHAPWLRRALLEDLLPWDQAQVVDLPHFWREYTVHDSIWNGLWLVPGRDLVALISWDFGWVNNDRIRAGEPDRVAFMTDKELAARDSPGAIYLLMHFMPVFAVFQDGDVSDQHDQTYIVYASSHWDRGAPDVMETVFVSAGDTYRLRIRHGSPSRVLCMNPFGRIIPLPDL